MSTTTDKIDPTVTLDKLIALLQGFKEKLGSGGNSDTVSRMEALGDEETQSKYYNKFGGGRALAGAILEVDGKVDKCATKTQLAAKADDLRIVLGGLGNASADTIEGVAFNSWVNVPPEFEIDMSGDIGSKLWMPGASFAIPHLDSGNPVDFPITGWQHDETDSQKSTATLRPFYASDGKLVRGTVEAQLSTSTNSYTLHFRWEYAQMGSESGGKSGGNGILDIPLSVSSFNKVRDCLASVSGSVVIKDSETNAITNIEKAFCNSLDYTTIRIRLKDEDAISPCYMIFPIATVNEATGGGFVANFEATGNVGHGLQFGTSGIISIDMDYSDDWFIGVYSRA